MGNLAQLSDGWRGGIDGHSRGGSGTQQEALTNSPLISPGDYVSLDCAGGQILLNRSVMCNDTSVSLDLCDITFCQYSLEGVQLTSQTSFTRWQVSGTASVANPSALNTTLNLTVANVDSHYSGVVNLSLAVPGVYVSLGCAGGEIFLNGSMVCKHSEVNHSRLCEAPICQYSKVGVDPNPQSTRFTGWETSGDAYESNPFLINTSLSLTMPDPKSQYSGIVNLSLKTDQQTTPVQVTIHTFVPYAAGSSYASVTICTSSLICPLSNLPNGAVVSLSTNTTYKLVANSSYSVEQWDSNAGNVSHYPSSTTPIYITSSGAISLIVEGSKTWAGYMNSPIVSAVSFSMASVTFHVPYIGSAAFSGIGVWLGIGGFGGALWQAGIESDNGTIRAFWEARSISSGQRKLVVDGAMTINPTDAMLVTVSTSNGVSYATVKDLTTDVAWSVNYQFTPNTQSAEWIVEPHFNPNSSNPTFGPGQYVEFENLRVDSSSPTLEGCFFAPYALIGDLKIWPGALSEASGGSLYFTVY